MCILVLGFTMFATLNTPHQGGQLTGSHFPSFSLSPFTDKYASMFTFTRHQQLPKQQDNNIM